MPIPEHVDEVFKYFDRYTKVMAPNGKPTHMVAETWDPSRFPWK